MIAHLKGKPIELKPTEVILDVGGVGYHLHIPVSTYEKIKSASEVALHVHTYLREDSLRLFGFATLEEKNLFMEILNISGIGPAIALALLSGISLSGIVAAVREQNMATLLKIPGIGKNKAEKILFELKRKINKLEKLIHETVEDASTRNDAIEALISLGFDDKKASNVVDSILAKNPTIGLQELVRDALKVFSS
ncbi:MAG: Holliday junction branch migration protein RuvA [Spirochaetes bacterium]|nr:Holliday junction branch migration protein RuvA [Spirochaetota bacterium]